MSQTIPFGLTDSHNATPCRPVDLLMTGLVHLLAPLFLDASGGDVAFARMAARETVEAYRATSRIDLLAVAQIIAFGFGALGSLSLSMMDDLDVRLILRLRGNAVSLHHAAERSRRTLERSQKVAEDAGQAAVLEETHRTRIAEAQARHAEQAAKAAAEQQAAKRAADPAADAAADPVNVDQITHTIASAPCPASALAATGFCIKAALNGTDTSAMADPTDAIARALEQHDLPMFAAARTERTQPDAVDLGELPLARRTMSFRRQMLSGSAIAPLAGTPVPAARFSLRDAMKAGNAG